MTNKTDKTHWQCIGCGRIVIAKENPTGQMRSDGHMCDFMSMEMGGEKVER